MCRYTHIFQDMKVVSELEERKGKIMIPLLFCLCCKCIIKIFTRVRPRKIVIRIYIGCPSFYPVNGRCPIKIKARLTQGNRSANEPADITLFSRWIEKG